MAYLSLPATQNATNKQSTPNLYFWFADEGELSVADRKKISLRIEQFCSYFSRRLLAAKWIVRQFRRRYEIKRLRDLPVCRLRSALHVLNNLRSEGRQCSTSGFSHLIGELEAIGMGVILKDEIAVPQREARHHNVAQKPAFNSARTLDRPPHSRHLRLVHSREVSV